MEGEGETNVITAGLIMSTSSILFITVLTSTDFHKTNLMILQAFVILETVAVYSSLGVLTVDLLIEREEQFNTHVNGQIRTVVLLMSFGCCLAGAILAWSFLNLSLSSLSLRASP
ncbi:hypothetical protein SUGI_0069450 [Cryptomeria japonica]|nr:hypothetical protein SUGI_0069450 [Cryptomeria japonica]